MPGTIQHEMMPKGGRGLRDYEEVLMVDRSTFNNKVILDLGAGPELKFATDLRKEKYTSNCIFYESRFRRSKSRNNSN